MLDSQILDQLKTLFGELESEICLFHTESDHEKQAELLEMLREVAGTSDHISLRSSQKKSEAPRFEILKNDQPLGIRFSGIPGGHEFSSLVLAILNSDLKGKLPDQMIVRRIQKLKGPISLRTFISLSCENCPEVVQALNLMAIFNDHFEHEMVDGDYAAKEAERLKIQGVPCVIGNDQMISSGKTSLIDLLEKLESQFGQKDASEVSSEDLDLGLFDVVVIGGGPAGASSAIYTARKGLKTAVITDRMGGQLQDTKGIENLISVPYTEGPELSAKLQKHMSEYPDVSLLEHRRVERIDWEKEKTLHLNSGEKIKAKALILTTGAQWRHLNIEGEKEYLGRGVAFCPHCDGPFYKGKAVSVIGGGNSGVEAAIDLAGMVKSVTLIEFAPELKADQVLVKKLESLPNIKIIKNARTDQILGNGEKVNGLQYEDRKTGEIQKISLDGVFVQIGLIPNSALVKELVELNQFGEIIIDDHCRTNQPRVYAAGDVTTTPYKQIVVAMGEGAKAGLAAFEDLVLNSAS